MNASLQVHFGREMALGRDAMRAGEFKAAWHHLERAHILGQRFVWPHVQSHVAMLRLALREHDGREILGQLIRIVAAVPGSISGKIPIGNIGRATVGIYKPMPIPDDLQKMIDGPKD